MTLALPTVEDVEKLDRDQAEALFPRVADLHKALVQRLTAPPPAPSPIEPEPGPDEVLDVDEAAKVANRSASWMRKKENGPKLPGFHQPGGPGTRVGWWRRPLMAWARPPA